LARRDAGELGELGLLDVCAGEQSGEFGVQERPHGTPYIEPTSILGKTLSTFERSMRDNPHYRA
jgi:hypothetical protein